MGIRYAILKAFEDKKKRKWDKLYFFIDIHGTILKPNYTYGDTPDEFYPDAIEALQELTKIEDIILILYTCSHPHEIQEYIKLFEDNNIHFNYINENPEVKTDLNGYGCYDKKPYFNVLLDDKAGFMAEFDWFDVLWCLKYNEMNAMNFDGKEID